MQKYQTFIFSFLCWLVFGGLIAGLSSGSNCIPKGAVQVGPEDQPIVKMEAGSFQAGSSTRPAVEIENLQVGSTTRPMVTLESGSIQVGPTTRPILEMEKGAVTVELKLEKGSIVVEPKIESGAIVIQGTTAALPESASKPLGQGILIISIAVAGCAVAFAVIYGILVSRKVKKFTLMLNKKGIE